MIFKIKCSKNNDFLELLKSSFHYFSGDMLSKGVVFFTIPIFTRLMSPEEYGILSVYNTFVTILAIIYGFGVRGALARFYYEDRNKFDSFVGTICILLLWITVLITGLLIGLQDFLAELLQLPQEIISIGVFGAILISLFDIYKSYLQTSKQSKKFSILNVINTIGFISIAVSLMMLSSQEKYYSYAWAKLLIGIIIGLYCIVSICRIAKWEFSRNHLRYALSFSIPIIFHLLSQNILASFDLIIINKLTGAQDAGLYSVGYKVGMIQSIVAAAFLGAWTPIFYQKMNAKSYSDIYSLAKKYSAIVAVIGSGLILFSKETVFLFATNDYSLASKVVPYVVVGYFFSFLYTMYANYLLFFKKNIYLAFFTIIAGAVNITLNLIFIPQYGYIAAAWTTTLSYFLLFGLHYCNVNYILKFKNLIPIKIFGLSIIILFLSFIFSQFWKEQESKLFGFFVRFGFFLFVSSFPFIRSIKEAIKKAIIKNSK